MRLWTGPSLKISVSPQINGILHFFLFRKSKGDMSIFDIYFQNHHYTHENFLDSFYLMQEDEQNHKF